MNTRWYSSPLGKILLAADEIGVCGLWFDGQKYFAPGLPEVREEVETDLLAEARRWLDLYFSGREPAFSVPLHLIGTEFQRLVWELLRSIPYGETTTYGALSTAVAARLGRSSMSAQAVGSAVGHNPVSLLVPCHRVVGADGSLTGYAGGMERKLALLKLEKAQTEGLFAPKKETAF